MAKQRAGLGRGLDALISGASEVMSAQQPSRLDAQAIQQVAIDSIIPNPRQPRKIFREDDPELRELSTSIKEHGLLQPLVVTHLADTTGIDAVDAWLAQDTDEAPTESKAATSLQFQIIAGERRWRAARLAGLTHVSVVIKEATPQQMLELALIENIQRADLNPIEEALAYQALIQEFGLTQEVVAKQVGKDRSTITNTLRLLQLVPKVREALINQQGHFSEGHARALIGITYEDNQVAAMNKIIALELNVRQAEELAARIKANERTDPVDLRVAASPRPRYMADLDELETQFRNSLTLKVDLRCNAQGKGRLVLHFNNQDEFERLYGQLVKSGEDGEDA